MTSYWSAPDAKNPENGSPGVPANKVSEIDITFTAVTTVNVKPATSMGPPPNGCAMQLYLAPIFSDDSKLQQLSFEADWADVSKAAFIATDKSWMIPFDVTKTYDKDDTIVLKVKNIDADAKPSTYSCEVNYWNGSGVLASQFMPFDLTVESGGGGADLTKVLTAQMDANYALVKITKDKNDQLTSTLRVALINKTNDDLVPSGKTITDAPQIGLFFQFADNHDTEGYGYLTNQEFASSCSVSIVQAGQAWEVSDLQTSGYYWTITLTQIESPVIAKNDEIVIQIDGIPTYLEPGYTVLKLSVSNIPGYEEGWFATTVEKAYLPVTFTGEVTASTPNVAGGYTPNGDAAIQSKLTWTAAYATSVEVLGYGTQTLSSTKPTQANVPIDRNKTVAVLAKDAITSTIASSAVHLETDTPVSFFAMPEGAIVAWNGPYSTLPDGWVPCDGTATAQGAPDLSDYFIIGAGGTYISGNSGEAAGHNHTASWTLDSQSTETAGAHSHPPWFSATTTGSLLTHSATTKMHGIQPSGDISTAKFSTDGGHKHDFDVSIPTQTTIDTITGGLNPPNFTLLYIMKHRS